MAYLFGVIAFVVALLVSVMLHEAGHFLTAKRFGMKATQFFVGFGPTLWSWGRGETEYGVKALPLGGFVKITGYTPLEPIDPADEPRAFYRQPAARRAAVIVAGVVMNFALAFVLLTVLAMAVGLRTPGTGTTTVDAVSACVPAQIQNPCAAGDPPSPASEAGLRPGDKVISLAGRPVATWEQLRQAIGAQSAGTPVPIVVERGGRRVELRVRPAEVGGGPYLGVTARVTGEGYERLGPVSATAFATESIGRILGAVGAAVADLPAAIPRLFSPERADTPGGQVGSVVGATQVSGQIFSAKDSWRDRIALFLSLVISVNVFLGALNVLPLLPLDGGHLAVLAYERARAWLARIRGLPDPGNVDLAKLLPVTYIAVVLLIGLGVLLILADVFNPLTLPR
ncbi:M50 family metallopeptidase [Actinomadura sp. HBU206391]|uniref:M50 family metallopeptidase n=1 Tax=Actinomadura sp. HBU206391 TaxID=2731692 RepID=UPI00164F098A|nr:site-2 protease family protein [Actinomadura sp. HBU206391]MBC6460025.1 site-2 protease family protein [Actinomadura sp. HBU206391]